MLWEEVSVETVSNTLDYVERYNCRGLRNACIHFVATSKNTRRVTVTEEFVWLAQNCPSLIDAKIKNYVGIIPSIYVIYYRLNCINQFIYMSLGGLEFDIPTHKSFCCKSPPTR
jgi:hypothetical protein